MRRRDLPWVRIEKTYRFDTNEGEKTLAELFDGRSQPLVYHFMFGPDWTEAGRPRSVRTAHGAMTSIRQRHEWPASARATALHTWLPAGPLDENTDVRDQAIAVLLEHEAFGVLGGDTVDLERLGQFYI